MAGFLGGLFQTKAAAPAVNTPPRDGAAVARAIGQSPSRYGFYSSHGTWDIDRAISDGWERVLWVYRCVDAIATNQARVPLVFNSMLKKNERKFGKRISLNSGRRRVLQLLNTRPNSYESAAMFRYRLSTLLLLSRKGAFIEIVGDPQNPDSLHLLPPGSVYPVPDPIQFVSAYKVTDANMNEVELPPSQVIWIRLKPHPTDPYAQTTPLVSAGIAAETDFLARLFNRNFLSTDGRPGLLISVRGQMAPADAAEIKRRFSGGPSQAGQTSVIEGDGMDVVDLGSTPRDAQWLEASAASKSDILIAFGTPESVLGNASGRTFDNADAELEIFWQHTMLTHCDGIANAMDAFTGNVYDDDTLVYDYSTVDVLHRQERARQDAAISRWLQGATTWAEMREDIGRDPWSDNIGANMIILPSGFILVEKPEDEARLKDIPNVNIMEAQAAMGAPDAEGAPQALPQGQGGAQPPALPAGPSAGGNGLLTPPSRTQYDSVHAAARAGASLGVREGARQIASKAALLTGTTKEDDAAPLALKVDDYIDGEVVHPYEAERKELEARLDGILISLDGRQAQVIADRLTHVKSRKFTRHWDGEVKDAKPLDPSYAVETDRWVSDTVSDFKTVLTPTIRREAKRVMRDMVAHGFKGDQNIDAIVDSTVNEVLGVVEKSARNMTKRLSQKIEAADSSGDTLDQIKQMVADQIGNRSTWRKGLTGHTSTAAYEMVRASTYAAMPKVRKTWNTEEDEKVRDSHQWVDGVTVKVNDLFHVGGTMMRAPGDPLAPVEEVANCRCWLTYQV